jgi:dipeptidyl aminopeptidase/acylaminoacyl peptidase
MRPMETLEYPARDGLPIHAYLTIPANHGPAKPPLVVMIHGGPEVRDKWGFDDEVQLLAASGYVVFQPQFRGSSGFGKHYEEAGYRQWGLAMQDDITDGVKHLIERGLVDATRICIAGASYGGYAALWGVIKTPELYRCGISFAGVSDIERFLNRTRDTDAGAAAREMRRSRIGDPSMHQAELDAVSPIKHVDQIKSPLLISHGSEDVRVPFSQSERFVRTLRDEKKEIVWLPIDGEGHGLILPENRRKYYTAELKFLNQYIGEGGQTGVDLPTARSAGASAPPSQ